MNKETKDLYEFGEYLLNVREKNLRREGELVPIAPKVFETLQILVEKRGEIVSKDEMLEAVWQNSFVEESNISQNIYTLRQMFGGDNKFIETVPKKGYRFAAPVKSLQTANAAASAQNDGTTFVIAARTATHIIEEETFEDFPKSSVSRKVIFAVVLAAVCFVSAGFSGYFYYFGGNSAGVSGNLNNFEIKSLTDTGDVFSPTVSPDGKLVAYLKQVNNEIRLNLKDVESGSDVEISIENGIKPGFAAFSPDGRRIFFRARGRPVSSQNIYEISYMGGAAKLFAEDAWGFFSFSPDGEKIAFYRDKPSENKQFLVTKKLSGGAEEIVLERRFPQRIFLLSYPVWSPDGKKIAFLPVENNPNRSKITILDLETRREETLETELQRIWQFVWMPDGKNLLGLVREEDKGWQMWRIEYPNGAARRVTNDLNSYRGLSISADGTRIVTQTRALTSNIKIFPKADFNRGKSLTSGDFGHFGIFDLQLTNDGKAIFDGRGKLKRELWIFDSANGSRLRVNENNTAFHLNTAITADGKTIFSVFDPQNLRNIFRMDADGKNSSPVISGKNQSGIAPSLSPDEKWLYFIKLTENSTALWRKSLLSDKIEPVYEPSDFAMGNFLAISPDGKFAALHYIAGKKESENQSENENEKTQIGFLNLADKRELKIREIDTDHRYIVWSNGGQTFDYVRNTADGGRILRASLTDENRPPEVVFQMPAEEIFRFAWSPDEKNLAVAHGANRTDAVILQIGK